MECMAITNASVSIRKCKCKCKQMMNKAWLPHMSDECCMMLRAPRIDTYLGCNFKPIGKIKRELALIHRLGQQILLHEREISTRGPVERVIVTQAMVFHVHVTQDPVHAQVDRKKNHVKVKNINLTCSRPEQKESIKKSK